MTHIQPMSHHHFHKFPCTLGIQSIHLAPVADFAGAVDKKPSSTKLALVALKEELEENIEEV